MLSRGAIRWLLRPLAEPSFLRLYYLDATSTPPGAAGRPVWEELFWSLPATVEHPERERDEAWEQLNRWLDSYLVDDTALGCYRAVIRGLWSIIDRGQGEAIQDLARFCCLGDMFPMAPPGPNAVAPPVGYHEIHCHFRSGFPFFAQWVQYLSFAKSRKPLRFRVCGSGRWPVTWAQLVQYAAKLRKQFPLGPPSVDSERQTIQSLVSSVRNDLPPQDWRECAAYLAICAGLHGVHVYTRHKPGLFPFARAYKRHSTMQKEARIRTKDLTVQALRRFEGEGAHAVELRPTLDLTRRVMQGKLTQIVHGYFVYLRGHTIPTPPVALGLVPSLHKQECLETVGPPPFSTWENQAQVWEKQVRTLLRILDQVPALRYFVVGVDAAGEERGCAPRALKPSFDLLREYNSKRGLGGRDPCGRVMNLSWLRTVASQPGNVHSAFATLNSRPGLIPAIRLGITVHVGEDFVDPMTGLRRIAEARKQLCLGRGDRIGHAVAAALAPSALKELLDFRSGSGRGGEVERLGDNHWRIAKPRGSHLLDLAWEHGLARGEERAHLGSMTAEVATRALGAPVDLARLLLDLDWKHTIARLGLPAHRYRSLEQVNAEDREWVHLDGPWMDRFERRRQSVLNDLVANGITVESCPTSNMLVAGLKRPPLFALVEHSGLKCALGTDNPGLFDAWPLRELDLVAKSTPIGQSPYALLERLLKENERASFVRRAP